MVLGALIGGAFFAVCFVQACISLPSHFLALLSLNVLLTRRAYTILEKKVKATSLFTPILSPIVVYTR